MKYYISEEAFKDLNNIWFYTFETWSAEQADRYYDLILDEIEYISSHFESGRNMDIVKKGYMVSKVRSHLIFYKKAENDVIEIVRILHQMMDIQSRLK
ncbi:type II toxin-antitoxin system RelE/ParE family toxin [Flavobacterium sp. DGU11]|uniref:Toxin n=1 Tax=Flavobacterium arundinis TaxID=3139143 RepID=A0ABU9HVQ8_9FLAO